MMNALTEFIHTTRDSRELKRALAVRMVLTGDSRVKAAHLLAVSESFIDKWRRVYRHSGVTGLRVGYQGSVGYLTAAEKAEILAWVKAQPTWDVRMVQQHVWDRYRVRYKSPQSYYALLKAARMSWKKSQDRHPDADPKQVAATREEIKKNGGGSAGHYPQAYR